MQKEEMSKKIIEVVRKYPVGALATIKDGKPWVRFVVFVAADDLTLYSTTFAQSRKIEQLRKNHHVHIALGMDPGNWTVPYINVEGTAEVLTDSKTKSKFWKEEFKQYYQGPDDPNYVIIKITPVTIEYMAMGARQPEVYMAEPT